MTPAPILEFHRVPGLSPKRALGFLVAAALVVLFATHERLGRAWNWWRISRHVEADLDAWLRDVFTDETDRRQP